MSTVGTEANRAPLPCACTVGATIDTDIGEQYALLGQMVGERVSEKGSLRG
jgi:hypothetical protein